MCGQGTPCLEEIEGFRKQAMSDGRWSGEDQALYLRQRDRLERGVEVPSDTTFFNRSYVYKKGRRPRRNK